MKHKQEPTRNRPAEEGKRNDPNLRDESAAQPGTNTMSSSDTDISNQQVTRTASDNFRTADSDSSEKADPSFDETGNRTDRKFE